MTYRILILDDETAIRRSLSLALSPHYHVKTAGTVEEGRQLLQQDRFDVCLLDLCIGADNGIDVLREFKCAYPNLVVIMITAFGSIHSSVEAMRAGAFSYLTKPLDLDELFVMLEQAAAYRRLVDQVEYLSTELENRYQLGEIVGRSPQMQTVYKQIERLKEVDSCVIVTGESGTGKELVARALHFNGKRRSQRFVEVNCAAIPEGLLEEEMFGHAKGSFTGAVGSRRGKFEYANHGTLFLDEIGDLSLPLQAKLLRVLQQKEITPIGSNEKIPVDVRVISATNRNIRELVEAGGFRQDLFYRLGVIELKIPPLRERKQDIPLLISHFIKRGNKEMGKEIQGISPEAQKRMIAYQYPGNVRELANAIEYAMVFCDRPVIGVEDLPAQISDPGFGGSPRSDGGSLAGMPLWEVEKRAIEETLRCCAGNIRRTAEALQISDKGLRNKIKEYGIRWKEEEL
ncbi:MAG: sigma-54-dependent Fis family transcriptional regulator [Oscillospiraceae bacterium]|nr:MAG: sigma-54-dependent Fis family transcriptional regulator [Oscillospiraceae bacterium]